VALLFAQNQIEEDAMRKNYMGLVLWLVVGLSTTTSWAETVPQVDGISGASYALPAIPRPPGEIKDVITDWLQTHWFMSLATVDRNGNPHVSGVTFYVENMVVYFKTEAASTKAVNIKNNPNVAYTVWDKVDDMKELKSLQVVGHARILEGEERDRIAAILEGSPGSTQSNLDQFFQQQGIERSYSGKQFNGEKFVVIAVEPGIARFNDNTMFMGRSDVYKTED
jgi:hypothetical protein